MRILFKLVRWGQRASFLNITAELKASELSSSNKQHVVVVYWHAFNVNDRRQTEGLSVHTGLICVFLPGSIQKCFNESVRVKRLNKSAQQRRGIDTNLQKPRVCWKPTLKVKRSHFTSIFIIQVMEFEYYLKYWFKHEGRITTQHKNIAMIMTVTIIIIRCFHLLSVSETFYQICF